MKMNSQSQLNRLRKKNDSISELKDFLEEKYRKYNKVEFIETDPISIPRQFSKQEDREIAGFLAATIAWGQRPTILKNANELMRRMDFAPHQFILNFKSNDLSVFDNFVHRTFNEIDLKVFMKALQNLYRKHRNLENSMSIFLSPKAQDLSLTMSNWRKEFFLIPHTQRTMKHFSDPLKGSAAKRLNMFLRWMVRKDEFGVDFGIWKSISPSILTCPLDVHSGRVARKLGLLARSQDDWQAARELTEKLKTFDPADPVKYDFALFGLGVFEKF